MSPGNLARIRYWPRVMGLLVLMLVVGLFYLSLIPWGDWAISIYAGGDLRRMRPHPAIPQHPVLAAWQVDDVPARFIADPFLWRRGGQWQLFFEVWSDASDQGEIGLASSEDGLVWHYRQIVLDEPFHLSYPYVFEAGGEVYMLPETQEAGAIRLYRARDYPTHWELLAELFPGNFTDPSILHWQERWWLFAEEDNRSLVLFQARDLLGPWTPHPQSPLMQGLGHLLGGRPGGRVVLYRGRPLRIGQVGAPVYGHGLKAFSITTLTPSAYREEALSASPILSASGHGWNAHGMHHMDALQLPDGGWIAAVDGKRLHWMIYPQALRQRFSRWLGLE